jgi:hypothetical protein
MKSIFILIILVIFLIGLMLWEIWPDRVEIVHLDFEKGRTKPIQPINCRAVDSLLDRQWEIRYPYSISKTESKTISVVLLDSSQMDSSIVTGESECDIAIEVYLDVSGIVTRPGSKIIEPYHIGSPLRFEWGVQAADGDVSGTIWIYVLSDENGGQSRYPLFALPVEFKNILLMGISPRMLRITLNFLMLISIGIYFLVKSNR